MVSKCSKEFVGMRAIDRFRRFRRSYFRAGTFVVSNRRVVKIAADGGHRRLASGATAGRRRHAGVRDEVKDLMILSEGK